jgi:hypothetical protein
VETKEDLDRREAALNEWEKTRIGRRPTTRMHIANARAQLKKRGFA